MPVGRHAAVIAREGEVVVCRAEGRSRVAREERHSVPAAVRQTRVRGRCDRHLIEVLRPQREVVREEEVPPPTAVVADVDRDPREDLVLHGDAELPVVGPDAPSVLHLGVDARGHEGVAEVGIVPDAAVVAAGREIVLRGRIHQVAVRNEIMVAVGPVPRRGLLERHRRIVDGVEVPVLRAFQVFADVHLHGRLAVPEQIVRRAHARCDVVEAGDANLPREDVAAAKLVVGEDPVLVGGKPAPRALVSHRPLQRETPVRPLVLCVEAVVARAIALPVRAVAHRELRRHAVVERVAQLIVDVLDLPVHLVRRLVADFEVVGAGHVGDRRAPDVVLLIVGGGRVPATIREDGDRDAGRGALLGDGDETRRRTGRNVSAPLAAERRETGLEQQAVRRR